MVLFLTLLLALVGLFTLAGGAWLIVLGGSWYYLIIGLAFLLTAILLRRRHPASLFLFALITAGSLAWAIWEVGFDWWALAPRGGLIVVLGLLMLVACWRANPERLGPMLGQWRAGG